MNSIHAHNPDALPPAIYHASVGPALKAAADVAARRGYPTLHDDLPCMIALVELVTRLADLYLEETEDATAATQLEGAPLAAAVMVLREAEIEPDSIDVMVDALAAAHRRVGNEGVIDDLRPKMAMAWPYLTDDNREAADRTLRQGVLAIAEAIDAWESPTS